MKLVTLIIAKAREPICCDHDAETSKPPAYLFRYISMSKIIKTKSNTAPIHKAPRPTTSPLEATSATSPEPLCVSVRRYLGPLNKGCKHKMNRKTQILSQERHAAVIHRCYPMRPRCFSPLFYCGICPAAGRRTDCGFPSVRVARGRRPEGSPPPHGLPPARHS